MCRSFNKYILVLVAAALFVGGCAKQQMVKQDETIPPATLAKPAETTVAKPSAPEAGLENRPVTEAPLTDRITEQSKAGDQAASAMDKIFFDLDSYSLNPVARDTLAKNAGIIKNRGGVKIRIEGHCDERGSDEYNLALGEKRAKAALDYLVTMGVPAKRLSVISYGKEKPADPGHDEAAWAKNRRDELVIVSK
jgi:peptidoglycan-associated lipoprotein